MQNNNLVEYLTMLGGSMTFRLMGDLLLALFLVGLLAAFGSFLGMARVAARASESRRVAAVGGPGRDLLEEYRRACEETSRAPLLWYAYLASLWTGIAALLLGLGLL